MGPKGSVGLLVGGSKDPFEVGALSFETPVSILHSCPATFSCSGADTEQAGGGGLNQGSNLAG